MFAPVPQKTFGETSLRFSCPEKKCHNILRLKSVKEAYKGTGMTHASCDECNKTLLGESLVFHCPPSLAHDFGFDLCVDCGTVIMKQLQTTGNELRKRRRKKRPNVPLSLSLAKGSVGTRQLKRKRPEATAMTMSPIRNSLSGDALKVKVHKQTHDAIAGLSPKKRRLNSGLPASVCVSDLLPMSSAANGFEAVPLFATESIISAKSREMSSDCELLDPTQWGQLVKAFTLDDAKEPNESVKTVVEDSVSAARNEMAKILVENQLDDDYSADGSRNEIDWHSLLKEVEAMTDSEPMDSMSTDCVEPLYDDSSTKASTTGKIQKRSEERAMNWFGPEYVKDTFVQASAEECASEVAEESTREFMCLRDAEFRKTLHTVFKTKLAKLKLEFERRRQTSTVHMAAATFEQRSEFERLRFKIEKCKNAWADFMELSLTVPTVAVSSLSTAAPLPPVNVAKCHMRCKKAAVRGMRKDARIRVRNDCFLDSSFRLILPHSLHFASSTRLSPTPPSFLEEKKNDTVSMKPKDDGSSVADKGPKPQSDGINLQSDKRSAAKKKTAASGRRTVVAEVHSSDAMRTETKHSKKVKSPVLAKNGRVRVDYSLAELHMDYSQKSYWEQLYRARHSHFEWFCTYEDVIDDLIQALDNEFGGDRNIPVLEFGCGISSLAAQLAERSGFGNITCVDFSQAAIDKSVELNTELFGAKGKWKKTIRYKHADLRRLDEKRKQWFSKYMVVLDKGTLDAVDCGNQSSEFVAGEVADKWNREVMVQKRELERSSTMASVTSSASETASGGSLTRNTSATGGSMYFDNFGDICRICRNAWSALKNGGLFIIITSRSSAKRLEFVDELKSEGKEFKKISAKRIQTEMRDWRDQKPGEARMIVLQALKNRRKNFDL